MWRPTGGLGGGINYGVTATNRTNNVSDVTGVSAVYGGSTRLGPGGMAGSYAHDATHPHGPQSYNLSFSQGAGMEAHYAAAQYQVITIKDIIEIAARALERLRGAGFRYNN